MSLGGRRAEKSCFLILLVPNPENWGDLATEGCDKKEPYQGGTLTPQSTLPDAAQPVGTGTGGKTGDPDISTIIQAAALGQCSSVSQAPDKDTEEGHHVMSHLAAPQHLPSWPRSCSRYSGQLPPQGPGAPQPRRARPAESEGWTRVRLQARPGQGGHRECGLGWGSASGERQKGRQGSRVK